MLGDAGGEWPHFSHWPGEGFSARLAMRPSPVLLSGQHQQGSLSAEVVALRAWERGDRFGPGAAPQHVPALKRRLVGAPALEIALQTRVHEIVHIAPAQPNIGWQSAKDPDSSCRRDMIRESFQQGRAPGGAEYGAAWQTGSVFRHSPHSLRASCARCSRMDDLGCPLLACADARTTSAPSSPS